MSDNIITDYENVYNTSLQEQAIKAYENAERVAHNGPVRQTGNTGPAGNADEQGWRARPNSAEAYIDFLEYTYPDFIFTMGEFENDPSVLNGVGGIMLSEKLLDKMAEDPEYGLKMEMDIAEIISSEQSFLSMLRAQDAEIFGHGVVIDEKGIARTWGFTLENINSSLESESTDTFMKMEELREKAMTLNLEHPGDGVNEKEDHIHLNI